MQILSYSLSRATTLREQLDFSGPAKDGAGSGSGSGSGSDDDGVPQQCALFHETTSPDSNGHVLMAEHCYGFLTGPAEVSCAFFSLNGGGFDRRQVLICEV